MNYDDILIKMPRFLRYLNSKKRILKTLSMFFVLSFVLLGPINATAILYQPGETLDPACLPSDVNCGVDTTQFSNTLTLSATSLPVTPTDQLYNIGGILYWNGNQISGLSGITSLNGITSSTQSFTLGSSGTDFNITSAGSAHVFNFPSASTINRGLLTASDWTTFNSKQSALGFTPLNPDNNLFDLASASTARTNLGLGNVENTTLSTWIGSTNITTLGTIASGTWNGNAIAVVNGGTGTTNGSITGTGALTFTSATTNALTLDSGTTGAINIGTGGFAKTITLGNVTGATAVNINSGTGNINLQSAGTSTTGNIQIGAGDSGSATPDLLVLDKKNTSGDPTGTNGAVYYNASSNKFRCYQNGAWSDCISSSGNNSYFKGKSTDQSVTSDTSLHSDTELTFPINSGETWAVNYDLYITNNNSGQPDLKLAILGASGWTCSFQMSGFESAGTNFPQIVTTDCDNAPAVMVNASIGNDSGKGITVHIFGTITATSSGSVTLQFAQNTSSINPLTIKAGSYLEAFRTTGADIAEIYYANESLTPGTIVSLDPSTPKGIIKSSGKNDKNIIGVISTRPGLIIGDGINQDNYAPAFVALSGRVPIAVSKENGAIKPGDFLTSSSTPGIAMRAEFNSNVIGQALSGFDGNDFGQILMFVKNFDLSASTVLLGDISQTNGLTEDFLSQIQQEVPQNPLEIITRKITDGKEFLVNFVAAKITAIRGYFDEVFAKKIHTDELCIKKSDGLEICISGDQVNSLMQNTSQLTPPPHIQEEVSVVPETENVVPTEEETTAPEENLELEQINTPSEPPPEAIEEPIIDKTTSSVEVVTEPQIEQ